MTLYKGSDVTIYILYYVETNERYKRR